MCLSVFSIHTEQIQNSFALIPLRNLSTRWLYCVFLRHFQSALEMVYCLRSGESQIRRVLNMVWWSRTFARQDQVSTLLLRCRKTFHVSSLSSERGHLDGAILGWRVTQWPSVVRSGHCSQRGPKFTSSSWVGQHTTAVTLAPWVSDLSGLLGGLYPCVHTHRHAHTITSKF